MYPVKSLLISGFRGIRSTFELDFMSGKNPSSMVVYGRNGTGKSSITDAWEWFHTGTIGHLKREGAGPNAYCHRNSVSGETSVSITFTDAKLKEIHQAYDHKRPTKPTYDRDMISFRSQVPHPCQIRFRDLTEFVYLTKTERFDKLAEFMGFVPQVEYQKSLRSVSRQLADELDRVRGVIAKQENRLSEKLDLALVNETALVSKVWVICDKHGVKCDKSLDGIRSGVAELKQRVTNDTTAYELSRLKEAKKAIGVAAVKPSLLARCEEYQEVLQPFKVEEDTIASLLLAKLYETGRSVLSQTTDPQLCPLCGARFEGDLISHVEGKHQRVKGLQEAYERVESLRKSAFEEVRLAHIDDKSIQELTDDTTLMAYQEKIKRLRSEIAGVNTDIAGIGEKLRILPREADTSLVEQVTSCVKRLSDSMQNLDVLRTALASLLQARIIELEQDNTRSELVDSHTLGQQSVENWDELVQTKQEWTSLQTIKRELDGILDQYIADSTKDVESRFSAISSDVETYFRALEKNTPGIGAPKLRLPSDQDRSVVLEVEFLGEAISPAYKYLSESQLNSFGLSVFLASVKQFNTEFKFIVLDDIINSFDAYKRPQLDKLLESEFSDYQILVLTHDRIWKDNLYKRFPTWNKIEFTNYAPTSGPIHRRGVATLERIHQLVEEDRPDEAGRNLGPYMEQQLQDICESFGVAVKYNLRNEFTLSEFLEYLYARLNAKLGRNHDLTQLTKDCYQIDSGFRNFCAHWKNEEVPYSKEEMGVIVGKWEEIETMTRCKEPRCYAVLQWTAAEKSFVCPVCGKTRLSKAN